MKMTPELAQALVQLRPLMDKANQPGADSITLGAAFGAAQALVREHNAAFAEYFAARLSGTALSYNKGEFNYWFKDAADVALTFNMTTTQQVDDSRSKAVSIGVVNMLLRDLEYPSSFSSDDSYLTAMVMIAHAMNGYRLALFNRLVAEEKQQKPVSFWPYVVAGAVIVAALFVLLD